MQGDLTALLMTRADERPHEALIAVQALVKKTLAGDPAAFEEIVHLYERRVLRLSLRFLGGLEDAQDAAQEVFLRAFRYLHRLDPQKPIEPWLMQMTVNVCRDIGRKRGRRNEVFSGAPDGTPIADESGNPHCGLAWEQQRALLRRALDQLPEKERMAVILRDVEGFSTSETAGILRSSESTVRSQICRGRLKLTEIIHRRTGGRP